ncbi:MAG: hypothetical protein AABZ33_13305 [Chloroflexota bacterium]
MACTGPPSGVAAGRAVAAGAFAADVVAADVVAAGAVAAGAFAADVVAADVVGLAAAFGFAVTFRGAAALAPPAALALVGLSTVRMTRGRAALARVGAASASGASPAVPGV